MSYQDFLKEQGVALSGDAAKDKEKALKLGWVESQPSATTTTTTNRVFVRSSVVPTGTLQFNDGVSRPNIITFAGQVTLTDVVINNNGFLAISGRDAEGNDYPMPALNEAGLSLPISSHREAQEAGLLYILSQEKGNIPPTGKLILKKVRNAKGYINFIVKLD